VAAPPLLLEPGLDIPPPRGPVGLPRGGVRIGAAAALVAAARRPGAVGAVVSRGGQPDLARDNLPAVTAPTLLIVGGDDEQILGLNRQALALLRCPKEFVVIPGATHLFPEPGALEEVARLATRWFQRHLGAVPATSHG
jgi:pimeloyl-ACP methyl ester carboxylesterase